ncbi:4-hydroxythreonine-4-phosphate dehydrogenase PdxA [Candidatus Puniceispirillum sp.]|nr:4-hydroxythreonine-4-phosphate dehydrogenase PdxA [Candidatus Puniceispirillum sp.]
MLTLPLMITPGEPAGIGTEIALKAWQTGINDICLMGSPEHIAKTAQLIGIKLDFYEISHPSLYNYDASALAIIPVPWHKMPIAGSPNVANAPQIIEAIRQAVIWCQSGDAAGLVTNPIQKASLYSAGFAFPGHTEYLASLSTTAPPGGPMMMLACDDLKVVPATVHIALNKVPKKITIQLIIEKCTLMHKCLRDQFKISQPRIAICGLNPHAGEDSKMGKEDSQIIVPAIRQLVANGINATGPHPADTLFHTEARKTYDAVLGMYHDQVLTPLKTIDFFGGVNITLGLSFTRTSPDHGTGLDIAGSGIARPDSLIAAIKMARKLARNKSEQTS